MKDRWREELPDPVTVPFAEVRGVISRLEHELERLAGAGDSDGARALDEVIGRMTRWVWGLLGELDQEEGYDD